MLTTNRRTLVCGLLGLASSALTRRAQSLPVGIGRRPDYAGPIPSGNLGRTQALQSEADTATQIIAKSPTGPAPYDVAKYFLALADGAQGSQLQAYASGWPDRWNPVIVKFFQATSTLPAGDVTPWCAAFVNWCFLRSTGETATHSASSGTFRCLRAATNSPTEGDIVVFREVGDTSECSGPGHVGFFVRDLAESVEVLGGNQIEAHTGCHKISKVAFPKKAAGLVFHSYRHFVVSA